MNRDKQKAEIEKIRSGLNKRAENMSDEDAFSFIEDYVFSDESFRGTTTEEKAAFITRAFCSIRCRLGILQPLVDDESISEIMVNGRKKIFVEQNGRIRKLDEYFDTTAELEEIIRRIAAAVHREINEMNPIVDARLSDGSRVNAVYKNVALGGPVLTIRKFPKTAVTMERLIESGTVTKEAAEFLKLLVESGYNIFVSGGTSTGKTTFLNILSEYIPATERVIVIEDSAELQLRNVENLVRMECRNANVTGKGAVSMADLIKSSLRMRPDRIIVGEVRGGEVLDMIQAMNTGHDGSLCTGHANSVRGMMKRLEAMFLQAASFPDSAIRSQIAEGIDIVVHLGRLSDKKRRVLEISEVTGIGESGEIAINTLFRYSPGRGLLRTKNRMRNTIKLEFAGKTLTEFAAD
ncbi:MAG: CpaF family protein [Clostridia bacterium]|nr:CpaF family protein [Clostridia bacterium]